MKGVLSRINNIRGNRFNVECISWMKANSPCEVEGNVNVGPTASIFADKDLGDVDVFLYNIEKKVIYSVECKEVNFAREPHQVQSEWRDIDPKSSQSWIAKHSARHEAICSWLQNGGRCNFGEFNGFTAKSLIITSEALPTPYLKDIDMLIVSMNQLKNQGFILIDKLLSKANKS